MLAIRCCARFTTLTRALFASLRRLDVALPALRTVQDHRRHRHDRQVPQGLQVPARSGYPAPRRPRRVRDGLGIPHSPTCHSLTLSPTRPLARPLVTPSRSHPLTHSSPHPLTHSPAHSLPHSLMLSCIAVLVLLQVPAACLRRRRRRLRRPAPPWGLARSVCRIGNKNMRYRPFRTLFSITFRPRAPRASFS